MNPQNLRNIALFAHVDAGKTTISEQFLWCAGKIKEAGSVDKGNSQTDSLEVERERGITVNSTLLSFVWETVQINLIDTPGHVDFGSETEKAIQAIDGAVIIVSALEGLQSQTEYMIELLQKHRKPFLIFINKIDRMGADSEAVISELKTELNIIPFTLQKPEFEGENNTNIRSLWDDSSYLKQTDLIEQIVEYDETLFEQYLSGQTIERAVLQNTLKDLTYTRQLIPVLLGSAKNGIGIADLLNAVITYLPPPKVTSQTLSAVVFKTNHKEGEGKLSAIRIFGGTIASRDTLLNASKQIEEKIKIIKNIDIQTPSIIQSFSSGEIAWVQGLKEAEPGDYLGTLPSDYSDQEISQSLLTVQMIPKEQKDRNALIEAMLILNNEDPNLNFEYLKESQEFNLNIRGQVQQEILQSILLTRFNIAVDFSKPTVIYKETPTKTCEGFVRYWLPKPCWAIMKFKIEPGERGSGVVYASEVGVNDIKQKYQNDVEKAIPFALKQGVLGWQVDDVKITLIEGEDHEAHTKSNDFTIATPMGIMEGLAQSESTLLEPIFEFKITAPEIYLGTIISELLKMRAQFGSPQVDKQRCKIQGKIPLATSVDFPIKLSSITSGKGKIITSFHSYQACDVADGETREYKGISPLDTAKYILKARKALT